MAGTWSCNSTTPDRYPTKDLFWIIREAWQSAPTTLEALIIDEAAQCALAHLADASGSEQTHCDFVLAARESAAIGDWPACIAALKHMGVVVPGATTPPIHTWPCDTGSAVADTDVDLFTVIQLANFNAEGEQRSGVIDGATRCGLYHSTEFGTLTAEQHCEKVQLAKEHAQGEKWDFCIEALDHTGGIRASVHKLEVEKERRRYKTIVANMEKRLRSWSGPLISPEPYDPAAAAGPD